MIVDFDPLTLKEIRSAGLVRAFARTHDISTHSESLPEKIGPVLEALTSDPKFKSPPLVHLLLFPETPTEAPKEIHLKRGRDDFVLEEYLVRFMRCEKVVQEVLLSVEEDSNGKHTAWNAEDVAPGGVFTVYSLYYDPEAATTGRPLNERASTALHRPNIRGPAVWVATTFYKQDTDIDAIVGWERVGVASLDGVFSTLRKFTVRFHVQLKHGVM